MLRRHQGPTCCVEKQISSLDQKNSYFHLYHHGQEERHGAGRRGNWETVPVPKTHSCGPFLGARVTAVALARPVQVTGRERRGSDHILIPYPSPVETRICNIACSLSYRKTHKQANSSKFTVQSSKLFQRKSSQGNLIRKPVIQ